MEVTHIAGVDVTIEGRHLRQRCAWCDVILLDCDLTTIQVQIPEDGSEPVPPGGWPVGRLVANDGPATWTLDEDAKLPDNFCGWATLAKPDDFTTDNDATSPPRGSN